MGRRWAVACQSAFADIEKLEGAAQTNCAFAYIPVVKSGTTFILRRLDAIGSAAYLVASVRAEQLT